MSSTGVTLKKNSPGAKLGKVVSFFSSKPLALALLLNITALIIRLIFFEIKYEVSDDYMTDAVLSGAFGNGYDPHLLFGNIILGYILVFFYKLIPSISFYFVLLVALAFVSVTVVLYLLFKKKINLVTFCLAVVFLSCFTDDLYVLIQFTKVSAVAGIAGGLLVLNGLWNEEKKLRWIISGSVLMILGTLVRFDTIFLFGIFLVISFIFNLIVYAGKKKEDKSSKGFGDMLKGFSWRFFICVMIFAIVFGLQYLGSYLNNLDEEHRKFNEFQPLRYGITDIHIPEYEQVKAGYENIGLDYTDYTMLCLWSFIDRDVYTDEVLENVREIHSNLAVEKAHSFSSVVESFTEYETLTYPSSIALYLMAFICLLIGKKRLYPVLLVFAALGTIIAMIFYGRTVYRVEWSIIFCAASVLLSDFTYDEESRLADYRKELFGKNVKIINLFSVVTVCALVLILIPRLFFRFSFMNMTDEEYRGSHEFTLGHASMYIPQKVGFPTTTRRLYPDIVEHMENDTEHYYYADAYCIQHFYFDYDPWIRPEEGLFKDSYAYYGCVLMHHPGERYALISNGVDPDNPYSGLMNDNILFVDDEYPEHILNYLRKYYSPDVEIERVAEYDGYSIWNFYIPDGVEDLSVEQ